MGIRTGPVDKPYCEAPCIFRPERARAEPQREDDQVKATMSKEKLLTIFGTVSLLLGLLPSAYSQKKNEVGLVIGATATPSQTVSRQSCIGPTCDLTFNESLALGAEYDRHLATAGRAAIDGGVD